MASFGAAVGRSLAAIGLIEGVMRLSRAVFNYRYGEKLTVYVVYDKQTVKISITSIDTIEHFKAVVGVMIGVDVNDFDLELNGQFLKTGTLKSNKVNDGMTLVVRECQQDFK